MGLTGVIATGVLGLVGLVIKSLIDLKTIQRQNTNQHLSNKNANREEADLLNSKIDFNTEKTDYIAMRLDEHLRDHADLPATVRNAVRAALREQEMTNHHKEK